jgi:hypothetical protein
VIDYRHDFGRKRTVPVTVIVGSIRVIFPELTSAVHGAKELARIEAGEMW